MAEPTVEQLVSDGGPRTEEQLLAAVRAIAVRVPYLTTEDIKEIREAIIRKEVQTDEALVAQIKDHVGMGWWNRTVQGTSNQQVTEQLLSTKEALESLGYFTGADKDWVEGENFVQRMGNIAGPMWINSLFKGKRDESDGDWVKRERESFAKWLLAKRAIDNKEFDQLIADGFYRNNVGMEQALEMVSDLGVPDELLMDVYRTSTSAIYRAHEREREATFKAADIAAATETLTTDDEKRDRRRQFEALDDEKPGKYVWNSGNSHIYMAGSGEIVDGKTGEIFQADPETGVFPEGVQFEDQFWQDAVDIRPPWEEFGIEEDGYYSMLEVVENPDQFHKGGIGRFTSGQNFLGGLASDYGIVQSNAGDRSYTPRTDFADSGLGDRMQQTAQQTGRQFYDSHIEAQVDRPWYDIGDQFALYAGLGPEAIAERQQELVKMGAVEQGDIIYGEWGDAESTATEKMMVYANERVQPMEEFEQDNPDFWKEWWEVEGSDAASNRAYSPPTYRRLDPARSEIVVQETMRRLLGRDASSDELADLGSHMQDMHRQSFTAEVQAQRTEYDRQTQAIDTDEEPAGGTVQGIDWEARFLQTFEKHNKAELARYDRTQMTADRQQVVGGALSNMMNMLGGGIG